MSGDALVWKIAAGVVIGGLVLGGISHYQEQMAIRQFNEELGRISAAAEAQSRQAQADIAESNARRERQIAAKRQAEAEARQLLPGQRCIGKDLFNRVENGWVQVVDGSAELKCGR